MSKAIDDLMNDHEAILSALHILETMTLNETTPIDRQDAQDFLGFLKEFADLCHHTKEEDILFPALIGAGIPDRGGPIGAMMSEHDRARALLKQMQGAINGEVDRTRLAGAAREYMILLRNHIRKENLVVFPLAEKVLSEAQLDNIYDEFEEHEEMVIGKGRHEELHEMLHKLEEKYPVVQV